MTFIFCLYSFLCGDQSKLVSSYKHLANCVETDESAGGTIASHIVKAVLANLWLEYNLMQ